MNEWTYKICLPKRAASVAFSIRRGFWLDPVPWIKDTDIVVKHQHKFLNVVFYAKLNLIPHLNELRSKFSKSGNILKVLPRKVLGSNKGTPASTMRPAYEVPASTTVLFYRDQPDPLH